MAQYYDSLAPNQVEALKKPCRKCGKGPHPAPETLSYNERAAHFGVTKRIGRFGPWVQCNSCGDKVYRPRGRAFYHKQQQQHGSIVNEAPISQALPVDNSPYTPIPEGELAKIVAEQAKPVFAKLETLLTDANANAIAQFRTEADDLRNGIYHELAKLQAAQPVVIHIKQVDESIKVVKDTHYLMPRLLRLISAGFHVYLWGDAGTGKSTAAMQALEALGKGFELDTFDPTTQRSNVQGYNNAAGKPVHTSFTRCWMEGKGYIADETDNSPAYIQTLFNSALANGHAPLAWGNVARQDGFAFIGTGNTPGRPTRAFPDRKPMSAAFLDRLYFIHWPLDPAIECRKAGLPIPPRPAQEHRTANAKDWVTFVQSLRSWAKDNVPTLMITPRASLLGVDALALGESVDNVADALIFRGADSEIRSKALNAVRLP